MQSVDGPHYQEELQRPLITQNNTQTSEYKSTGTTDPFHDYQEEQSYSNNTPLQYNNHILTVCHSALLPVIAPISITGLRSLAGSVAG